jgi:hypothetical protein
VIEPGGIDRLERAVAVGKRPFQLIDERVLLAVGLDGHVGLLLAAERAAERVVRVGRVGEDVAEALGRRGYDDCGCSGCTAIPAMIVVSSPGSTGLGMCMLKPAARARRRSWGRP